MRQARYRFFLLPLFFVLACVGLYAQANSELTGIVTDQTGAVVAGAKIVVTESGTGASHTVTSGGTGLYDVSGLNPGTYNIKVSAKGFESYVQNGIVVNVSATARADAKLTVGAETQTVTIEADALAVQADSNVVSTLISSEQISEIATENRNFAALAALGLGVSSALPDSNTPTSVAANFTISVNGLRQSHNIWLIDGGEADDRGGAGGMDIMPSQDAIAEFTMMSSNYPPDYGISSGATISLSLKSGTQKFHGEAYEFNRNTDYDANNYFNKQASPVVPRASEHYNIFGFNIGGPLYIPKAYNTDKQHTFFFWNEEWRKIIQGAGTNVEPTIPDADRPVAGTDLVYVAPGFDSGQVINVPNTNQVGDPAYADLLTAAGQVAGTPFTTNGSGQQVIPASMFDATPVTSGGVTTLTPGPNAALYFGTTALPKPNTTDGHNITNVSIPINVRDDVVRVDHKWNDKWQVLGHYMHDNVVQNYATPDLGWLWASYNTITSTLLNPSNSAALKLSGTITPNLLLEASMNYDGNIINITNSANAQLVSGWTAGNYFTPASNNHQMQGMGGWANPYWTAEQTGSVPYHNAAEDYEPKVDVSYTAGKHAMKFGFSYNRYTKNQQLNGNENQGDYAFTAGITGDAMMDEVLGLASGYDQSDIRPIRHYVNQTPSVYAMDNWHVTPRLSLQLGLRFDSMPHAWERSRKVANFNIAAYLPSLAPNWVYSNGNFDGEYDPAGPGVATTDDGSGTPFPFYVNGLQTGGENGTPVGLVNNDYKTYQPRVGFSEDLFGNGKTVLRGGFGTFFERLQGNDIYNAAASSPYQYNAGAGSVYFSVPNVSYYNGSVAGSGPGGVPTSPAGITNMASTYRAPAVAQYSLGVQHEIVPSVIWVIQYVGNLAWHQNIYHNINNYPLSTDMGVRCDAGDGANHLGSVCPVAPEQSLPSTSPWYAPVDGSGHPKSLPLGNAFRTFQGFGGINQEENTTNGGYNGFQTGVRLQNKWGLSGEVDYTWSHEIDVTTYDLSSVSNPWNFKYDKASGALDRRHMLSINYVYKLPLFAKGNDLAHSILGGWELAGTFIDETGLPAVPGISINYDTIGLGGGYTNRPDQNKKMTYAKKQGNWFDTTAFQAPIASWLGGPNLGFGNSHRDAVVGPGRVNFTTSLYKSFAVTERAHFELRFESFNTFNHTQFNNINTTVGASQYGQVTSTWDPRVLELGGKFVF